MEGEEEERRKLKAEGQRVEDHRLGPQAQAARAENKRFDVNEPGEGQGINLHLSAAGSCFEWKLKRDCRPFYFLLLVCPFDF